MVDSGGHSHNFDSWPFPDVENTEAFTTVHVLDGSLPILLVTHDEDDGAWQFLCGTTNAPRDGRIVCLGCMYQRDASLAEIADLPLGWRAWRDSADGAWQREQSPAPTEE